MICPICENIQSVYYDPSRGFKSHRCHYCGSVADLHPGRWVTPIESKKKADEMLRRVNEWVRKAER